MKFSAESQYIVFKENKHASFESSEETINKIIGKIDSRIINKKRLTSGETNEVYSLKVEPENDLILRISRKEDSNFEGEKWVLEQCATKQLPVPQVLLVGEVEENGTPLKFSIETKLPGNPLGDLLGDLSTEELNHLMNQAGEMLSKINSIEVNGFGRIKADGSTEFNSAEEVLKNNYFSPEKMMQVADECSIDENVMTQALDILHDPKYTNIFQQKPQLIHGDFTPANILVDNGNISGLIDFEFAEGGDPAREFANWDFFYKDSFPIQALSDGYTDTSIWNDNFALKYNIWKVYLCVANIVHYSKEKNESRLEQSKQNLVDVVHYFNQLQ